MNIGKNMAYYSSIMQMCIQFFFVTGFVGVSYFGSEEVKDGKLTPGEIATYLLYNWQIIFNIMGLTSNLQQVARVSGAFYEIARLITEPK